MIDVLMNFFRGLIEGTQQAWNFLTAPIGNGIVNNLLGVNITPLELFSVGSLSILLIYYLIRGLTI